MEVIQVKKAPLENILTAVGSLSSPEETMVTSQIDGKVTTLNIRQGKRVKHGDILATLDDSVLRAEVQAAEADLFNARQIFKRDMEVKESGAISAQQLQSDEAAVRRAEAELQTALANLAYTRISAPFSGSLGLRQVSLGTFIKAGDAIVSLHQYNPLHLDFNLPQQNVSSLKTGQTVHFSVSGLEGHFDGKVTTVDPALSTGSRTIRLQATVANPDGRLKLGMFAQVHLVIGTIPMALLVPMQALTAEGQVNRVWVVGKGQTAELRTVQVGRYQDNWVQILAGLTPQDKVITAGVQKLRPGARLKISPYEPIHNPRFNISSPAKAPP
ncbi:MAG: efflux RND transporter periplasmic adaptor subunit [Deltaproteobacteria bacterium]